MSNNGHRCGEIDRTDPENTLERLRANHRYEYTKDWAYLEFDLVETKDNKVIVFHDRDLKRFGDKRLVKNVTHEEMEMIANYTIPTLEELLDEILKLKFYKPIRVEIKRLNSEQARHETVVDVNRFRMARWEQQQTDPDPLFTKQAAFDVQFMAFRAHWKKSFPKSVRLAWKERFEVYGFKVLDVKSGKDLFQSNSLMDKVLNWL